MREAVIAAGCPMNEDGDSGDFLGVVPLVEGSNQNMRTWAAKDYDLSGVKILFEKQVHKVLLHYGQATGV